MVSRPRPDAPERQINRLVTRVDRVENGAPLRSTSVTDGHTRFVGEESLIVEGSARVTGTLVVSGIERVTGILDVEGTLRADGVIELNGPTTISGDADITGDTTIAGQTRLTGSLSVAEGGSVRVGEMTITEAQGGAIEAPLQIVLKSSIVEVQSGIHVEQGAVFDGQITAASLQPISIGSAPAGAFPGAIMRDASKRLRVVVADS